MYDRQAPLERQDVMRSMRHEAQDELERLERRVARQRGPMTEKQRKRHDQLFQRVKRYAEGRL